MILMALEEDGLGFRPGTIENQRFEQLGLPITSVIERVAVVPGREPVFDHEAPGLMRLRVRAAVYAALGDLIRAGLVDAVPANNSVRVPVAIEAPGGPVEESAEVWLGIPLPEGVGRANGVSSGEPLYLLSRRMQNEPGLRVLDSEFFAEGLAALPLDARARRCLDEALEAYRREMYLSCVTLLGQVSEAAWYAAGELLRCADAGLARLLDQDAKAEKVIGRIVQVLEQKPQTRPGVQELHAHAGLLRALRNYGVHPRGEPSEQEEHAFTEEAAGLLILESHRYLARLANRVEVYLANG